MVDYTLWSVGIDVWPTALCFEAVDDLNQHSLDNFIDFVYV